jgi:predicted RNA-binding Zn ribbon-like protein
MNVTELERQVEYKFAPAPLLAVQALANTYSFERDEELLRDPEMARRWLLDSGLIANDAIVDDAGLAQLVELRTLIRNLLDANLTGEQDRKGNERLGRLAADHPVSMAVSADGVVSLDVEPAASVDDLIGQMVGIVFQSQTDATWPRLKVCAADDCRWAFFDSSRNRGGTWCQMEVCGNRVKNRTYRSRRSAAK